MRMKHADLNFGKGNFRWMKWNGLYIWKVDLKKNLVDWIDPKIKKVSTGMKSKSCLEGGEMMLCRKGFVIRITFNKLKPSAIYSQRASRRSRSGNVNGLRKQKKTIQLRASKSYQKRWVISVFTMWTSHGGSHEYKLLIRMQWTRWEMRMMRMRMAGSSDAVQAELLAGLQQKLQIRVEQLASSPGAVGGQAWEEGGRRVAKSGERRKNQD